MTDSLVLTSFSMRSSAPPEGADWFRIVKAKKGSDITKVYIYDEIGFWGTNAKDFAAALDEIDTKEIHLHLNSPGGSVFDGLAIYNTIKNHSAKVTGIVDGMAASIASLILQGADVRQISRNAQVMIHDAKAFAGGNAAQMRQAADLLDRISNEIADVYAVRAGSGTDKTAEDFRSLMKAGDKWYNGNEALDAGLVDEVTDNPAEEDDAPEEATKNTWDAADVEAFLSTPPGKLAAAASHLTTTNRVEEAQMGDTPTTATPPPPAQPPAPTAQATPPVQQPTTAQAAVHQFLVNGAQVADATAVQEHINSLELFKKESIETGRKSFVAQLAADGKILASDENLSATEKFALSLTSEQFETWKATQTAAPVNELFKRHGADQGDTSAPTNGGKATSEKSAREREIANLEEIVQGHRDSGIAQDKLEELASFKRLQDLKSQNS